MGSSFYALLDYVLSPGGAYLGKIIHDNIDSSTYIHGKSAIFNLLFGEGCCMLGQTS